MANTLYENIFFMLGGIAFLMFGMKIMGSNLEQVAGNNLKKMLGKVTDNRFGGVLVGAGVTALINSSTATTVMLVGFVNIGLMTLVQATSVIMGANIGTTIISIILAVSGTGFKTAAYASLIAVIGMVFSIVFKKDKLKKIGNIMLGIGLIFMGLEVMSASISWIVGEYNSLIFSVLSEKHFPLILILIGLVLTAIMHSSGALTAILIALGPAISFQNAAFIILGSNIGTCVTSLVSSVGTSTNAKRTAVIHLLFNLIGCILFIIPVWIWGDDLGAYLETTALNRQMQIAVFHVVFNVGTTLLLIGFIKPLVCVAEKLVPDKNGELDEKHRLTFIDDRLLETPPIAVGNIKNEIIKMGSIARENINYAVQMLIDPSVDNVEIIKENEKCINFFNRSITDFLTKLMGKNLNIMDERKVGSYYHVVSDVERVGDYAENIMEYAVKLRSEEMSMSPDAVAEIKELTDRINALYDASIVAFDKRDESRLAEIDILEESVDTLSESLGNKHIERVKKGQCTAQAGSFYLQTVSNLERVGDHITNLAFSIKQYNKN